jgi:hypothetical protein
LKESYTFFVRSFSALGAALESWLCDRVEQKVLSMVTPSARGTAGGAGGIARGVAVISIEVTDFRPLRILAGYEPENMDAVFYETQARNALGKVEALMSAALELASQGAVLPSPITRETQLAALGKSAQVAASEKEAQLKRDRQEQARRLNRNLAHPPKGRVSTKAELPAEASLGERWIVKDSGRGFYFDGVQWVDDGVQEQPHWRVGTVTADTYTSG